MMTIFDLTIQATYKCQNIAEISIVANNFNIHHVNQTHGKTEEHFIAHLSNVEPPRGSYTTLSAGAPVVKDAH